MEREANKLFLLVQEGNRAFQELIKLSKCENPDAENLFHLAEAYYHGYACSVDYTRAKEFYCKAAKLGHRKAAHALAVIYSLGVGTNIDISEAAYWHYRRVKGLPESELKSKDPELSNLWLYAEAEPPNTNALYYLGKCYSKGYVVSQDHKIATRLFYKAANKKHIKAFFKVAWAREQGIGITVHLDEAAACYYGILKENPDNATSARAAAALRVLTTKGSASACHYRGDCYRSAIGCQQNTWRAVYFYHQAIALNYTYAEHTYYNLAAIYETGKGNVKKDVKLACHYFLRSNDEDLAALKVFASEERIVALLNRERRYQLNSKQLRAWFLPEIFFVLLNAMALAKKIQLPFDLILKIAAFIPCEPLTYNEMYALYDKRLLHTYRELVTDKLERYVDSKVRFFQHHHKKRAISFAKACEQTGSIRGLLTLLDEQRTRLMNKEFTIAGRKLPKYEKAMDNIEVKDEFNNIIERFHTAVRKRLC